VVPSGSHCRSKWSGLGGAGSAGFRAGSGSGTASTTGGSGCFVLFREKAAQPPTINMTPASGTMVQRSHVRHRSSAGDAKLGDRTAGCPAAGGIDGCGASGPSVDAVISVAGGGVIVSPEPARTASSAVIFGPKDSDFGRFSWRFLTCGTGRRLTGGAVGSCWGTFCFSIRGGSSCERACPASRAPRSLAGASSEVDAAGSEADVDGWDSVEAFLFWRLFVLVGSKEVGDHPSGGVI